ncbi:STAS domain protein [Leptospira weilii serovar Ranarum str. ICFT]|uniref:STAS domain protein n=1 Tax=Leptospira weilii serovar Ranarum str. ICFT TaxID=1218598 RepID=N1WFQ0_9LEPT|nr:STAS domain-containing protein [Leptospira weilii]EMY79081.1 STAS domain protein [Leptospira weilii serovar Ranarum str. ICFT]
MPFLLYKDFQNVRSKSEDSDVSGLKVAIEGELTIYEAAEFKENLDSVLEDSPAFIEIDLFKIQKMDTSCLQILLALKKEAQRKNKNVRLINHSRSVLRLIDLYGLASFLNDKIKLSKETMKEFSFRYGVSKD